MLRTFVVLLSVLVAGMVSGCGEDASQILAPTDSGVAPSLLAVSRASAEIGPAGGSVETAGVAFTIPAGALQEPVTVTLTVDLDAAGRHIEIEPQGLLLASKATLSALAGNFADRRTWNPAAGMWVGAGAQVVGGFLQSRVVQLSRFDDFE